MEGDIVYFQNITNEWIKATIHFDLRERKDCVIKRDTGELLKVNKNILFKSEPLEIERIRKEYQVCEEEISQIYSQATKEIDEEIKELENKIKLLNDTKTKKLNSIDVFFSERRESLAQRWIKVKYDINEKNNTYIQ